ncbi:MAG: nicotinate-nucleotide adenylyltransferase [Candidatus Omnitrophica bacterium]|nr:nicotinate-nucleotide adenylyltransferase [Candidatus Omnitrophota bacterium]
MKRIGILGGTFNPVHIGHLAIAEWACEQLKLDKVIFVPSHLPPHKTSRGVLDSKHRFEMVLQAVKDNPCFGVSDFEVNREGKSYSIDTVEHFRSIFPKDTKFYFIIGEDALTTLSDWKDIDRLTELVDFVAVNRPGTHHLKSKVPVKFIPMLGIDVSSSYVRKCLTSGKSAKYFLPENVIKYIKKHHLYTSRP